MVKTVTKKNINIITKHFFKRLLIISIIITNIFFYIPTVAFAANKSDKKAPAVVPSIANEIISKYVSVKNSGSNDNTNSESGGTITNYEESGDGWGSVTKVEYPNGTTRTYRNYKQFDNGNNSYWNQSFWGSNIWEAGCGPTSVAIVLSGYGYDANPGKVVDAMSEKNSGNFENLIEPLKRIGKIDAESHSGAGTSADIDIIRDNFKAGRPVIINAPNHYVVYLGEDKNGKLIISDPGKNDGGHDRYGATLEEVINNGNITYGYILIKSDSNASDSSKDSSKDKKDSKEEDNEKQENKNNEAEEPLRWPIGSEETTTQNGKTFALGTPAIGTGNVSRGGTSRGWCSEGHEKNGGQALDIHGNGQSNKYNVVAMASGKIESCGDGISEGDHSGNGGMGNYAIIDYGAGMKVRVMHMYNGSLTIHNGDTVEEGQVIGKMGNSGDSTGTHTHLDMTINGEWVDVAKYIAEPGKSASSTETSNNVSETTVNMSGNIIPNDHGGYKINIDLNKEIDEMLEKIKQNNFQLEKYLRKSVQKRYLKNFIKSAIVTQYPDLRAVDEIAKDEKILGDETQGCIKIKRYIDNETEAFARGSLSNPVDSEDKGMYLAFKPYDEFSKLISSGDKSVFNYFSMDSSNNIVVAGWETSETSVSIEQIGGEPDPNPDSAPEPRNKEYLKLNEKKIDYVNQVSNYTMPFSLLWSLLVYGNDEEFVNDLAKLVINTEIVIGSYDATNVKVSTYTNTYEKVDHIDKTAGIGQYDTSEGQGYAANAQSSSDKVYNYKVTEVHTLKTDTPNLKLKYADTWTAVYNNGYKVKKEKENIPDSNSDLKDEKIEEKIDYKNKEDIEKELKGDLDLQKKVDEQLEKLKENVRSENERNYSYRYQNLTKVLKNEYNYTEEAHKSAYENAYKLLYDKNIQDYIINMILEYMPDRDNLDEMISSFKENKIVINTAKKMNNNNYMDLIDGASSCIKTIVENSRNVTKITNPCLKDQLTKNGKENGKNKIYTETEVTSIIVERVISKVKQKENIKTDSIKAKAEGVTNSSNNVISKIDKNSQEDNFVKLLYHSKKAKGNLDIVGSWFFESVEKTAAIADMEDLLKYLFEIVYKGESKLSKKEIQEIYDLFDPEKFQTVSKTKSSNGKYSTDLEGFLFAGEGGDEYIKGDIYIVYDIGDGCLNIGHGVVIGNSDGTPWYPELIPNPHVGQEISKEIYDKVVDLKMKQFTDALDASLAKYGVTLKQNQYDAMISFLYNTGAGNADAIVSAYKNGGDEGFWNEIKQYINPPEYSEGLMNRRGEEYELFIKGDYNYNPNYSSHKYY